MYIPKVKNICPWLRINSNVRCGNTCEAEYCAKHAVAIRRGSKPPVECESCGKGTQCIINLCINCGQQKKLDRLYKEKRKNNNN